MAISTVYTYDLNGTTRDFNIPFEYLARRFVSVTLIGQDRKVLSLTTDFRFPTKTSIQTTLTWGPANGYERIEIRRETSATERLVDFADGSILRAYEMNLSQVQVLHVAEEARNMVADTIAENADGDLDARGRRLVNLADATSPDHAVTLRQEQAWAESALNQATLATSRAAAALVSQNASKTSETNSKTSETNSKTSETNSKTSETNSLASQNAAKTSETNSKTSETNSKASEVAAKTSETNAKTSETNAAGWAAGVNLPSAAGAGGLVLRQKTNGTGLEYVKSHFAYGLGGPSAQLSDGYDLNNLRETGFYRVSAPASAPLAAPQWYYVIHQEHGDIGYRVQMAFKLTGADGCRMWGRRCDAGTWSAWREVWTEGSLPVGATGRSVVASADAVAARAALGAAADSDVATVRTTTPPLGLTTLWTGSAGNGSLVTLSDDAFKYESFTALYAGGPTYTFLHGLRELSLYPVQTQMYILSAPNSYIHCKFEDANTAQRRLLRLVNFGANNGFNNLYGLRRTT